MKLRRCVDGEAKSRVWFVLEKGFFECGYVGFKE
jgi:hypothetical protein